jgi:hypothetical protein
MTNEEEKHSDIDLFVSHLKSLGLVKKTIDAHIRNYNRFKSLNDNPTQEEIIKYVMDDETISMGQKLIRLSSASKYLKYKNMENNDVLTNIRNINEKLNKTYTDRNKKMEYKYKKQDILDEMERFYESGNKKAYLMTYLVVNFNTRNKDVDVTMARHRKYCKDLTENYLVLRKNDVVYIRNNYKTCKTYGKKENIIRDKKILECVNYFMRDKEINKRKLFDNFYNSTRVIKRYTPFGLKTTDIVKIILNCNNSLKDAVNISKNRGTNLTTLNQNYNLKV